MTKHTEGPWKLVQEDGEIYKQIIAADGIAIADILESDDQKTVWQNGFLMSAAPELLEACKLIVERCEFNAAWDKVGKGYYKAKQAIEKAEGKS